MEETQHTLQQAAVAAGPPGKGLGMLNSRLAPLPCLHMQACLPRSGAPRDSPHESQSIWDSASITRGCAKLSLFNLCRTLQQGSKPAPELPEDTHERAWHTLHRLEPCCASLGSKHYVSYESHAQAAELPLDILRMP